MNSTNPEAEEVSARCILVGPDSVVAAVPHLLGFQPMDSIVIVWIREDRITLTQRVDLPAPESALDAESLVALACHAVSDAAVVVIFGADPTAANGLRVDLVESIRRRLAAREITCLDALHVSGGRWWSYLCEEPCCPPQGRQIDEDIAREVASRLAGAIEPSRQDVVRTLEADESAAIRMATRVNRVVRKLDARFARATNASASLQQWRDEQIASFQPVFRGEAAVEGAGAGLLVSLHDIRVRDSLLWNLAHCPDPREVVASLSPLLRAAPTGFIAPIATCTAIAAWLCGDGVRAGAAVQRALADDACYSLAQLVDRSILSGLPPASWRDVMAQLSYDQCRTGEPSPRATVV